MPDLERRALEETAIEVRNATQQPRGGVALCDGRVQAAEEQRYEDGGEELLACRHRGMETIGEEAPLAVQPAFLLDERQEQQSRQDQQRLGRDIVGRFRRALRSQGGRDAGDGGAKALEEA